MVQMVKKRKQSNDKILCACGCGELIPAIRTDGKPATYKYNHHRRGKPAHPNSIHRGQNHYHWKGGRIIHKGYVLIYMPDNPHANVRGYVREHRRVMEEVLDRILEPYEHVHHINGNKTG